MLGTSNSPATPHLLIPSRREGRFSPEGAAPPLTQAPRPVLTGMGNNSSRQTVYTIGHSNRTLESFISLLKTANVTLVADIRTVPRSQHNPQFNADALPLTLKEAGIGYEHFSGLGGLRQPRLIPSTPAGAVRPSVASPITCKHPPLRKACEDSLP